MEQQSVSFAIVTNTASAAISCACHAAVRILRGICLTASADPGAPHTMAWVSDAVAALCTAAGAVMVSSDHPHANRWGS